MIDYLVSANSATSLNPDGSPLTFRTAVHGAERDSWKNAEDTEISRLLNTTTRHAIHLEEQPLGRRDDTTYYNLKQKKKYNDDDMNKVYAFEVQQVVIASTTTGLRKLTPQPYPLLSCF